MPDITMCSGEDCPLKYKCHRHEAKPNDFWQSYFDKPPVIRHINKHPTKQSVKIECQYFIKDS